LEQSGLQKEKQRGWHFIIPFYYGVNRDTSPFAGAPLGNKIEYLRLTLESLVSQVKDPDVHVFVRDDPSEKIAKVFPLAVHRLECPPKELPYRMLLEVAKFKYDFRRDDILCFTEDDQILQMGDSVKSEIEDTHKDYVFVPHRWSKLFLGFRTAGRFRFDRGKEKGVLENVCSKSPQPRVISLTHKWDIQDTLDGAYAGFWAMRYSTFRKIDLSLKEYPDQWLLMGSYAVFEKFPVLKLSLRSGEDPSAFLVNHLSGYDRNRRILA
jgi:hypothetical protein